MVVGGAVMGGVMLCMWCSGRSMCKWLVVSVVW